MRKIKAGGKETEGMMLNRQALELAKKVVDLDIKRDELFEQLILLVGDRAYELLRFVQNR
ncbi:hypothetical protein PNH38_08955 [Anoxybacillus rupiensis]|nr:hypothetical protein [Anoxybacillus rupiensis]